MKKYFYDSFGLTGLSIILIVIAIFLLFCVVLYFGSQKACNEFENKIGVETQYDFWNECLVKLDNDKWVSKANYQGIILE